jgi:predicted TIM-barrel enzyme
MQRLHRREYPMTALPARLPRAVNKSLTPKRPPRVVENDEYAAFLRRVIRAYSRRVAAGDIEAITDLAATAEEMDGEETILIIGTLRYTGTGWRTTGDALLASTAADQARRRRETGREELAHEHGASVNAQRQAA